MYCSRCGAKYEGNFCPNGCNSPYRAAPKPQKKAFPAWGDRFDRSWLYHPLAEHIVDPVVKRWLFERLPFYWARASAKGVRPQYKEQSE